MPINRLNPTFSAKCKTVFHRNFIFC